MKKYAIICADKGSYDRAIEFNGLSLYSTYEEALEELKGWIWEIDILEKLNDIIKNKETYFYDKYDDSHYFNYDENGKLIYYSNGCRATNEYDGHSVIIYELNI